MRTSDWYRQSPRPVPPKNGGTRTGHPFHSRCRQLSDRSVRPTRANLDLSSLGLLPFLLAAGLLGRGLSPSSLGLAPALFLLLFRGLRKPVRRGLAGSFLISVFA